LYEERKIQAKRKREFPKAAITKTGEKVRNWHWTVQVKRVVNQEKENIAEKVKGILEEDRGIASIDKAVFGVRRGGGD